jgi:hypothetical protein
MNFLKSALGGNSSGTGAAVVTASSEDTHRSTYQGLIREAVDTRAGLGRAP